MGSFTQFIVGILFVVKEIKGMERVRIIFEKKVNFKSFFNERELNTYLLIVVAQNFDCYSDFISVNNSNKCMYISPTGSYVDFNTAESNCKSMTNNTGRLAEIRDQIFYNAIKSYLPVPPHPSLSPSTNYSSNFHIKTFRAS